MSHDIFSPIEGRQDCRNYRGFVGIRLHKGQSFGVMRCIYQEYMNGIAGAKSEIGGILTERCKRCDNYQPKEGASA
jgi:hypothetical protein